MKLQAYFLHYLAFDSAHYDATIAFAYSNDSIWMLSNVSVLTIAIFMFVVGDTKHFVAVILHKTSSFV